MDAGNSALEALLVSVPESGDERVEADLAAGVGRPTSCR